MQSSSSSNDEFLNALRTSGADDTRSWLFELMVRASEEGARRALAQRGLDAPRIMRPCKWPWYRDGRSAPRSSGADRCGGAPVT
jgi:hypothetical protein